MPGQFEWVRDLRRSEWLRVMEAEPFGSILSVVPRGFQSYARVFHPVERDRPRDTKTWRGVNERTHFDGVADIGAALETEVTTWANAAASFGTVMHSEAQYARLLPRDDGTAAMAIAPDGWRYAPPARGMHRCRLACDSIRGSCPSHRDSGCWDRRSVGGVGRPCKFGRGRPAHVRGE